MATSKKRINLCLSKQTEMVLAKLADRDDVPMATEAARLIERAIEIDEDEVLNLIAEKRDTPDAEFVSHEKAWS